MLEVKIENLTIAIERLTAQLETLTSGTAAAPKSEPEPTVETVRNEAEFSNRQVDVDLPSRDRLQAKCLELVKADRSNRQRIADLIAKHSNGGRLIKDIADADLATFLAELEAL